MGYMHRNYNPATEGEAGISIRKRIDLLMKIWSILAPYRQNPNFPSRWTTLEEAKGIKPNWIDGGWDDEWGIATPVKDQPLPNFYSVEMLINEWWPQMIVKFMVNHFLKDTATGAVIPRNPALPFVIANPNWTWQNERDLINSNPQGQITAIVKRLKELFVGDPECNLAIFDTVE